MRNKQAGILARARQRLVRTWPEVRPMFAGAPLWGGVMALSAFAALYLRNGAETAHLSSILILFFCGGLLAWPCALILGRFAACDRAIETRFAAFFVCLTVCTIAATAFLFAMDYRLFYQRWHAPFGTVTWVWQFVVTSASAVYQFSVMGVRLFFPVGFAALIVASLLLARSQTD